MSPLRHMDARRALRESGHDSSVADTSTQKLKTVLACRMPTFALGTQRRGPCLSHRPSTPGVRSERTNRQERRTMDDIPVRQTCYVWIV